MIMVGSLGAGAIMRKTGKYYWLEIVGACGQPSRAIWCDPMAC